MQISLRCWRLSVDEARPCFAYYFTMRVYLLAPVRYPTPGSIQSDSDPSSLVEADRSAETKNRSAKPDTFQPLRISASAQRDKSHPQMCSCSPVAVCGPDLSVRGLINCPYMKRRGVIALGIFLACCSCASALKPSFDINQYAHKSWTIRGFFKGYPRLGRVIKEVRLVGTTGYRTAVLGYANTLGDVIPKNAILLKALGYVKAR